MSMPSTAAKASTLSRPSSDSIDTQNYDVGIGPWRILGRVTSAIAPVSGVHPLPRNPAVADRRIFRVSHNRARLIHVIDLGDLHAHDPLVEDRGDEIGKGFVDPHDRRDVGGLKPSGEIRDRFEVEGAMFVVDHAVVEAGGLDDPRDAARRELLEPGPKRGPPLAHRPPYAVVFHGSYVAPIARQRIADSLCDTRDRSQPLHPRSGGWPGKQPADPAPIT